MGSFALFDLSRKRLPITSRKGIAIIALLAMSRRGERDRSWLQAHLWGSRAPDQGRASLRRELSNLRAALDDCVPPFLVIEPGRVRMELDLVRVDVRELEQEVAAGGIGSVLDFGELLEGIDIPGEEAFEDWLRVQRTAVADLVEHARSQAWESAAVAAGGAATSTSPPGGSAVAMAMGADPPLPGRPSVAILAVPDPNGSAEEAAMSEAVADEIGLALSHYSTLFVVRAGQVDAAAGVIDRSRLCRRLGVRYILESTVRRAKDDLRVAVRLVDGAASEQVWAERFNGTVTELFLLYDSIAATAAPQIDASIEQMERRRATASPVNSSDAYQLYWRANAAFRRFEPAKMHEAIDLAEQILTIEPGNAWAAALAAFANSVCYSLGWGEDPAATRQRALDHYETALRCGADDPFVLGYAAGTLVGISGDIAVADRLIDRALALHPNGASTLFWGGWVDIANDRADRALQRFEFALRLNPRSAVRPHSMTGIGICLILLGRVEEAVIVLTDAAQQLSRQAVTVAALALALKLAGREEEAAHWAERLSELGGVATVKSLIRDPARQRALAAALGIDFQA